MHRPISRRRMLHGMGVAMALPWLEALSAADSRGSSVRIFRGATRIRRL